MSNLKMIVAYEGRNYLGWQKTREGPSIEESLQRVLEQILQQPIALQAASRTDAGVHALGQVVNCLVQQHPSLDRLRISLNSLLPDDIRVLTVDLAQEAFHPTLDCKAKEYHYWICMGPVQLPQNRFYSWHVHTALDRDAMERGAKILQGEHDFVAFCNTLKETEYKSTVREIESIALTFADERLQIAVRGPNFLYRMVRNLVGTLVDVGRGKIPEEALGGLLTAGDRSKAGITAPAHGLTLFKVCY